MTRLLLLCLAFAFPLALVARPGDEKDAPWRPVLPAKELAPLAAHVTAALKKPVESLASGKLDDDDRERAVKKTRGLALFLVAAAQTSTEDPQRGPLRNAGLKLDLAARTGKYADAKMIHAALPAAKGFDQPAFAPGPLAAPRDRDDVVSALMVLFRTRHFGGFGIEPPRMMEQDGLEAMLKELGKGNAAGLKPDEIARLSYHVAVLSEATRTLAPPTKKGEKDPEAWKRWSVAARDAAVELATAKDPAARTQAARRVEAACSKCHAVFRDN